MSVNKKISKKEFLTVLRKNGGLYARTAKVLAKEYGISYTRQGVAKRAQRYPEELKDIQEENIDVAEETLQDIMRRGSETNRLKACELFLKTVGKSRGYVEKQELEHSGGITIQLNKDDAEL